MIWVSITSFYRKNPHNAEEQHKLNENVSCMFFNEAKIMVQKKFEQWNTDVNFQLVLGAEKSISIAF